MEKFVIEGGHPLRGVVTASGNKNAALKLLPACLLTDEPVILHNIPDIADVRTMRAILTDLGVEIEDLGGGSLRIHARQVIKTRADAALVNRIRASIVLAGPMLARTGFLEMAPPGGDVIGRRRVDTHVLALRALGAQVEINRGFRFRANRLRGTEILLDEASVTATENAIMAAVMAQGTTVIRNAASEPHVQDLCHFLNRLGAQIEGIGSNVLTIQGVDRLRGGEYTIGADYLEVASFIAAAAVTDGEITIKNADPHHLGMIRLVFGKLGVHWEDRGKDVFVPRGQSLTVVPDVGDAIPEIKDMPWPAFPSDLMSIALVVATQAAGTVLFHEWMYENRLFFVDKLVYMGARIVLCDPHRCLVQGPSWLHGDRMESPDIRAGMALIIAALAARGTSEIRNIHQIDRGYERVDEKLRSLGAHIWRVEDEEDHR
ncbi:MAG: UDP-N-acetylglucosamine 1-carboxyvinyltransferase [Chloroflexi bacterium]|nr:MAG: UDP-N-acetylglucosamine 1-carboxyvinyltransferase [Chloroflexota bacterium]